MNICEKECTMGSLNETRVNYLLFKNEKRRSPACHINRSDSQLIKMEVSDSESTVSVMCGCGKRQSAGEKML
jgi:hypothetical protein